MKQKKIRTSETQDNGINLYRFNSRIPEKINTLITEYKSLIHEIVTADSYNRQNIRKKHEGRIKRIKLILNKLQIHKKINLKNVLTQSSKNDNLIGTGQDSYVYSLGNGYVYKEGKEGNERNTEYLQKKYKLLKSYLGDIIPKSYFIYGESISPVDMKGMHEYSTVSKRTITIQKEIDGENAQRMTYESREDKSFLGELEKAHKKYILLKFFIQSIAKEMGFPKKTLDTQLDLGPISKIDTLHIDSIDFIEGNITSPNIMWDNIKKEIKFIDFGYGEWDEKKELIYIELQKPENLEKWHQVCHSMGLN